ncbi:MAG: tyrosine-type recombinase/integrase [Pseudobdellovibrionaceae bacterium]
MRVELRKLSNGDQYFSFVYWDGERRVRLKKQEHPHFSKREEAEEWAKAKEAEIDSCKGRILRKLKWKTQFYEFVKLSNDYIENCKKTQPNSWKNTETNLHQYVFPFFLDIKKSNNPNNWPLFFEDYRKWLEDDVRTIKRGKKKLEYGTKNHCIKTLNTFLDFMVRKNLVDVTNIYKMKAFPASMTNSRDASALISESEFHTILKILKESNPLVAIFFETAYWTGMRFNEIYGLSLDDIFMGELEDDVLKKALSDHQMQYYGYIVLESQPKNKTRNRLPNGAIERKPLKGKSQISEKNNRVVPILNKDLFNNIVSLYKEQQKQLASKVYGTNPKDYVLFDGVTHSGALGALRAAYAKTNYAAKCYHCCRHTRCTELVGKTRDFVLARFWLGHSRQETTLRYTHIYQQSARTARKKSQIIDFV